MPGRRYPALIQAIDPLVDANGRSIGVRGCIDNRHLQLRPGMFARVTAVFGERDNARVIPEEAIVPQGGRQFVIRLVDGPDQDTKIAQRVEVKVGIRRPGRVEITEGLQPGDVVVTAGQQRVQKDGMPVRVLDLNGKAGPAQPGAGRAWLGRRGCRPRRRLRRRSPVRPRRRAREFARFRGSKAGWAQPVLAVAADAGRPPPRARRPRALSRSASETLPCSYLK